MHADATVVAGAFVSFLTTTTALVLFAGSMALEFLIVASRSLSLPHTSADRRRASIALPARLLVGPADPPLHAAEALAPP